MGVMVQNKVALLWTTVTSCERQRLKCLEPGKSGTSNGICLEPVLY